MRATCYNSNNTLTMESGEALGIAAFFQFARMILLLPE